MMSPGNTGRASATPSFKCCSLPSRIRMNSEFGCRCGGCGICPGGNIVSCTSTISPVASVPCVTARLQPPFADGLSSISENRNTCDTVRSSAPAGAVCASAPTAPTAAKAASAPRTSRRFMAPKLHLQRPSRNNIASIISVSSTRHHSTPNTRHLDRRHALCAEVEIPRYCIRERHTRE